MSKPTTREQTKSIEDKILEFASMSDEASQTTMFKKWLEVMSKFHNYSWNNQILINIQKPDATRCAGSRTWAKLGREVKSEEWSNDKRIWILAPNMKPIWLNSKDEVDFAKKAGRKIKTTKNGKKFYEICTGFTNAYVFDVSQTTGEELPQLNFQTDSTACQSLIDGITHCYASKKIDLEYRSEEKMDGAYGWSSGGQVVIRDNMSSGRTFAVLIHELAHELLHWKDKGTLQRVHDKSIKETEAETVSYVVASHFGLDMSNSKFYLACWEGDSEKIKSSLSKIRDTSKDIINAIEKHLNKTKVA
jgi:hypothetical protein